MLLKATNETLTTGYPHTAVVAPPSIVKGKKSEKKKGGQTPNKYQINILTVEDRGLVERVLTSFQAGLDFADALHHARYHQCDNMLTFDDKKLARRLNRLALMPRVIISK